MFCLTLHLLILCAILETHVTFSAEVERGSEQGNDDRQLIGDEIVPDPDDTAGVAAFWETFKTQRAKRYETKAEEKAAFEAFKENVRRVSEHNRLFESGQSSYSMRIHAFSDWTLADIQKKMMGLTKPPNVSDSERGPAEAPQVNQSRESGGRNRLRRQWEVWSSLDLREGYVSPVKYQGQCGCCWAMATAAALESQLFQISGRRVEISAQNLIDCSTIADHGCNGGWPWNTLNYIASAGGIMEDYAYPFKGWQGQCRFDPAYAIPNLRVARGQYLPFGDENALRDGVFRVGPIIVAINADGWGFINYARGVYVDPYCSQQVNHAVVVVGYGMEYGFDYWLVKNSWGTYWGEEGFIKFARNNNNQCGIASWGTFAVLY